MPAFQDASSPVTGFTEPAVKFVEDMKSKGEQVLPIYDYWKLDPVLFLLVKA